jgi:hypothetical protein
MPKDAANWLAIRLKALADPVRLQLLEQLLREPAREDCTCNLAPLVKLSEPTVSHHPRCGMSVYYRVVAEDITAIAQVLHVV